MDERNKKIAESIEKSGYSYAELSELTGISKSTLQRYATGETKKIPIDNIERIAKATKTDPRYLMGWEQNTDGSDSADNTTIMGATEKTGLTKEAVNNEPPITPHEKKVITAYRNHPEMQPAVDTLLGVEKDKSELIEVRVAARSKDGKVRPHTEYITREQYEAEQALLEDADEDL